MDDGEIAAGDPVVLAYALMGVGELVGMRWGVWGGETEVPPSVLDEVLGFVTRGLGAPSPEGDGPGRCRRS